MTAAKAARAAAGATVRRAELADADELARLRWRWRVDERGETGLTWADFRARFAHWWQPRGGSHLAFLAEVDRVAAGTMWLAVIDRVPGPGRWERRSGLVQNAYVVPEFRGRGVGTALLEALQAEAAHLGLDYLSVHPSERSFDFYRRGGFAETSGVLERRPVAG